MNIFKVAKMAPKFYNMIICDAEKLKGYVYESDIYFKYLTEPDLAMVPRLVLILCATYDGSLRLEWGGITAYAMLKNVISILAAMLPYGKYKDKKNGLFDLFLTVDDKIRKITKGYSDAPTQYLELAKLSLRFIYGSLVEVEYFEDLVKNLAQEYQSMVSTIRPRVNSL